MIIKKVILENISSFSDTTIVELDKNYSIFIGPNSGGKSNLLETIAKLLRTHFLFGANSNIAVTENHSKESIQINNPHLDFNKTYESFNFLETNREIGVTFIIDKEDISRFKALRKNKDLLLQNIEKYDNVEQLRKYIQHDFCKILKLHSEISFSFDSTTMSNPKLSDEQLSFLLYLNYNEVFFHISKRIPKITSIKPLFLYIPPYRFNKYKGIHVNLATENYHDLRNTYYQANSNTQVSLIKLASFRFAEKRRLFEKNASLNGFEKQWAKDKEVKLVSKFLDIFGYKWDIELQDPNKNIYEIRITQKKKQFLISKASSGEFEIINFIFGLFAFNIRGGIIIIDEPELHLHPRWQSEIKDVIIELSNTFNNQFLIATHSPSLIDEKTINNVNRVFLSNSGNSKITKVQSKNLGDSKDLLHIIKTHNNEKIFFSDIVVLVEGIKDRIIFEKLIKLFNRYSTKKKVIEILEVPGKTNFVKYRSFLNIFKINNYIIADLDYIKNISNDYINGLFLTDFKAIDKNVFKSKKSTDRKYLSQLLGKAISEKDTKKLEPFYELLKQKHFALKPGLTLDEEQKLSDFLVNKQKDRTFILRHGEIEDYLPNNFSDLNSLLIFVKNDITNWIKEGSSDKKIDNLLRIVFKILSINHSKKEYYISKL